MLATGFSHGFGAVPGNRELVEWLRAYNADRPPAERVRFHGFDAPVEYSGAPSPRRALSSVVDYLPPALRPGSAGDLEALLGEDAEDTAWTSPAAMFDPAASIGDSDRARALRIVADDLASALRRAAPGLRPADPAGYDHALAHARTAQGLLRYHAAMASPAPDRIATLLGLRAEMMAENLLAIVAQEQNRGPSLVFAHNAHLQRSQPPIGDDTARWGAPARSSGSSSANATWSSRPTPLRTPIRAPSSTCWPTPPRAAPCSPHRLCVTRYPVGRRGHTDRARPHPARPGRVGRNRRGDLHRRHRRAPASLLVAGSR
ncbi:erythromycin esterase family protein [Prauserella oleivorans]